VLRSTLAAWRGAPRSARLFLLAEGCSAFATGAFGAAYNLYVLALGYDAAFLGTLLTAAAAGAGLGVVAGGWLTDRLGPRAVLLASSVVAGAGIGAQLWWTSVPALVASSAVAGIGAAAYYVAAAPFLARAAGERRPDALFSLDTAITLGCAAAGTASAAQAAALLLPNTGDVAAYRAALLGGGVVGVVAFPLLLLAGVPPAPAAARGAAGEEGKTAVRGWTAILREPQAVRLAIVGAAVGAGAGLFAPYLNVYFVEGLGASPAVYGWLSAAGTATRLLATLWAPALAARLGVARAIGWTQLVSVPLLLLVGFGPTLAVAGPAFLVRGALMNMAAPLQMSFRMAVVPTALHGAGSSLIWLADGTARTATTWLGGQLIDSVGYRLPYLGTAACYVAAAGLFLWWFGRDQDSHFR
jgi:predicted MFS family arabinose efflux permease